MELTNFTLDLYENWFEALEGDLVNNVYHIDASNEQVEQELKSVYQNGKLIMLFTPEILSDSNFPENRADLYKCLLFVVERYNKKDNDTFATRKRIRNECLEICFQIRNKIEDIATNNNLPCHFFKLFNFGSVKFRKVGPFMDNMYGWSMEFDLIIPYQNF